MAYRTMSSAPAYQPAFSFVDIPPMSALPAGARQVDLEDPDGDEADQQDADEQQHGDRRAQADLQPADRLVVRQGGDRLRAGRALGHDVDVVEDAERVQRAE